MKKYLVFAAGLSVVLLLFFYLLNEVVFQGYLHPYFPALVGFFFLQSLVVSWMLRSAEKDKERFALFALGSVVFRFLSGMFFVIVLFMLGVEALVPLVIQFMGVYLLYLIFELFTVLANLRRN